MMEINKDQLRILAPKERYEQELDDANWKFKVNLIRNRDNRECQLCGAKKTQLDVHHIRYISGHKAWEYADCLDESIKFGEWHPSTDSVFELVNEVGDNEKLTFLFSA